MGSNVGTGLFVGGWNFIGLTPAEQGAGLSLMRINSTEFQIGSAGSPSSGVMTFHLGYTAYGTTTPPAGSGFAEIALWYSAISLQDLRAIGAGRNPLAIRSGGRPSVYLPLRGDFRDHGTGAMPWIPASNYVPSFGAHPAVDFMPLRRRSPRAAVATPGLTGLMVGGLGALGATGSASRGLAASPRTFVAMGGFGIAVPVRGGALVDALGHPISAAQTSASMTAQTSARAGLVAGVGAAETPQATLTARAASLRASAAVADIAGTTLLAALGPAPMAATARRTLSAEVAAALDLRGSILTAIAKAMGAMASLELAAVIGASTLSSAAAEATLRGVFGPLLSHALAARLEGIAAQARVGAQGAMGASRVSAAPVSRQGGALGAGMATTTAKTARAATALGPLAASAYVAKFFGASARLTGALGAFEATAAAQRGLLAQARPALAVGAYMDAARGLRGVAAATGGVTGTARAVPGSGATVADLLDRLAGVMAATTARVMFAEFRQVIGVGGTATARGGVDAAVAAAIGARSQLSARTAQTLAASARAGVEGAVLAEQLVRGTLLEALRPLEGALDVSAIAPGTMAVEIVAVLDVLQGAIEFLQIGPDGGWTYVTASPLPVPAPSRQLMVPPMTRRLLVPPTRR